MLSLICGVLDPDQTLDDIKPHFLGVKFISEVNGNTVFVALVNESTTYPESLRFVFKPKPLGVTVRSVKPSKHKSTNAKRKQIRKANNAFMTEKNWRQFVGSKHFILKAVSHLLEVK